MDHFTTHPTPLFPAKTMAERKRWNNTRMIGQEIEITQANSGHYVSELVPIEPEENPHTLNCCASCTESYNAWEREHANDVNEPPRMRRRRVYQDAITVCARKWGNSIVSDGSLPEEGFEITTSPAAGDHFIRQCTEMSEALRTQGALVTQACGLHTHVDARDLTWYDIRRVILLYARVEKALYALVTPKRQHNTYCKPCGDQYLAWIEHGDLKAFFDTKKAIQSGLYGFQAQSVAFPSVDRYGYPRTRGSVRDMNVNNGQRWHDIKKSKYADCRYNALNLHSWIYRGTLEWRLPPGTTQARKMIFWGQLFATLIDRAVAMTEKQIKVFSLDRPLETLRSILPETLREAVDTRRAYVRSLGDYRREDDVVDEDQLDSNPDDDESCDCGDCSVCGYADDDR